MSLSLSVVPSRARRGSDQVRDPTQLAKRLRKGDENRAGSTKLLDPAGSSKEKPKTAGDNFTQVLQRVENSLIHNADEKSQVSGDSSTRTVNKVASYCKLCRKYTDHRTVQCPDRSYVWHNGFYQLNYCDLCSDFGHVGELCPLNEFDMDYDAPGSDWHD
ncbi:hypothetical protein ABKV19_001953 [Rosa sericea]